VNGAIEISSAELLLSKDEALIDKLNAHAGNTRWTGFVSLPRGCGVPGACLASFELKTDQVALNGLEEWLQSPRAERRWYQVLTSEPVPASFLQNLRAMGKVTAGRMLIHSLVAKQVSASLDLEHGKLKISDLRADVLGGKHQGNWQIDFAGGSPVYMGTGTLTAISMGQVADAMHDGWISGTANGNYQLKASGRDAAAFWKSAVGALQFDVRDGILPHIALNSANPQLRIASWRGRAQLGEGKLEIDEGKLVAGGNSYEIRGTALLTRTLNFKLSGTSEPHAAAMVYSVTGTLADPRVVQVLQPQAQAKLKQ
jgi:uncharacterized protein involved in outer membrane biogenesis